MNTRNKALFAFFAVVIMLCVPLTVISSQSDATVSIVPTPVDYAYKITYYTTDEVVSEVQHYQSEIKAVYKDGNISGSTSPEDPVKYKNNGWILDEGSWSWNTTTGLGPFNMFYAAISKGTSDANALSDTAGMISYILNPYDLSQAVKYKAGDGSYTMADYNIMLVIPTVYWYSDGNGNMYISNSNSNPNLTADVNSNMVAYAHTADTDMDDDLTDETPYPYLALSVYEATETSSKIGSKTGVTPVNNKKIDTIRGELDTSSVGTYQLWNFYEWTLYKILAQAAIGSKDAQSVIGNGYDSSTDGSGMQTTGLGNTAGPYGSSGTAETKNAYAWSKLFIENSWGSGWEFVDNTYLGSGAIYAGTALTTTLSSTSVAVTGAEYVPTSSRLSVPAGMSQNDIRYQSMASATWDMPVADSTTWSKNPSSPKGAASDSIWTNNGQNSCLIVGGYWNNGASAGLSAWASNYVLSISHTSFGARLAYLMTADAAVADSSYTITFAEQSRTTSIVNSTKTAIILPEPAPLDDEEFSGWYLDSQYTKYVGPAGSYFTPTGQSTVLYAKYTALTASTITFSANSSTLQTISTYVGETIELPEALGVKDKLFAGWYSDSGLADNKFVGYAGAPYTSSASTVTLYAKYVDAVAYYTISVYEGTADPAVKQTMVIHAGESMILPESTDVSGYVFTGWYSGNSLSAGTLVGQPGQYYKPTETGNIIAHYAQMETVTFYSYQGLDYETEKTNTAKYTSDTTLQVATNEIIDLPAAKYLAGYRFIGWTTATNVGTEAGVIGSYGSRLAIAADTALYPYFEPTEYTITVYSWNGSEYAAGPTVKVPVGSSMKLPVAAELSSYAFTSWVPSANGSGSSIGVAGQYYKPTQSGSISPVYAALKTVEFKDYESTSPFWKAGYTISVAENEWITLPSCTVVDGKVFAAWTTVAGDLTSGNLTGSVGAPGQMYKVTEDKVLYPFYVDTSAVGSYTVKVYASSDVSGTSAYDAEVAKGYPLMLPEAPAVSGKVFSEWMKYVDGTNDVSIGVTGQYFTPTTDDVKIYPTYTVIPTSAVSITYKLNGTAADVSAYLSGTLSGSTCEVDGYVYLSVVKVESAVCSYTVTSGNAYVVPLIDNLYRIYVKSSSATSVVIDVDNTMGQGFEDFFVSGFSNQGQSIQVKLRGDAEAGLAAGTLNLGGIYCRYDSDLGYYVYGSIEQLGALVTGYNTAVAGASQSATATFTLPTGYYVYYAYGIYTVSGTSAYCGGMLGPAAVTLEPQS